MDVPARRAGDPPDTFIDLGPPAETWLPETIFTYHADEPDVTFECRLDNLVWENCGFDELVTRPSAGWELALEETQFGLHTFEVRASDFEGNVDPTPAAHTWRLIGIVTAFTSGPGFTPGPRRRSTRRRAGQPRATTPRSPSRRTSPTRPSSARSTSSPSSPAPRRCTYENLIMGEHLLRVLATSDSPEMQELEPAEYEWEVLTPSDERAARRSRSSGRPRTARSSTFFEFVGVDDLTPAELLIYECRLDSTSNLDWEECPSPFNLLDRYTYEGGGAGEPLLSPGPHTFEVRAVDNFEPPIREPEPAGVRGQRRARRRRTRGR